MSAPSRGDYLWEVLRTLWPPPACLTRVERLARADSHASDLIVLPDERRATLALPRRPWRAAASALRHYKASATTGDQLRLRAAALAARTGLASVVGEGIRIEPAAAPAAEGDAAPGDIGAYLRGALGRDVVVSLSIGAARANRKPVLLALAPDGEPLGFVKIGITPLTRELVRAEVAALSFLGCAGLTQVRPPRLLHHGQWRGHEVMIQEALTGHRPAAGLRELAGAMTELAAVRGVRRLPPAASPYWARLRSRLAALPRPGLARPLTAALGRLEPQAGAADVTFGSWHGDWAPWNMTMAGGKALVWDWERFGTGVPVGYDAVHYWLQGAIARGGMPAREAARQALATAPELVSPLGVASSNARLVVTLYLIEIAARYLHDGQAEAGAALGDISTWLLPALAASV